MTDDNSGRKADIARAIELARRVDAGQEPLTPFDPAAMFDKARRVARIAVAIEARQWSPEQAAAALDMTPAELRELLAGRFRGHSLDDLERLASRIEK